MALPQNIGILGCGWLGLALAKALAAEGVSVLGTTTRADRIAEIRAAGATPLLLDASSVDPANAFFQSEAIIVSLTSRAYPFVDNIVRALSAQSAQRSCLILLGSISVFGRDQGDVDEQTTPEPSDTRGMDALMFESAFQGNLPETTVLRLGGLVGPDRHPGTFLAGQVDLKDGAAAVNLVHVADVVAAVRLTLARRLRGEILHVVCDEHASREEFYPEAARALGLEPPRFVPSTPGHSRRVSAAKLKAYGFRFKYPLLRPLLASWPASP